MMSSRHPDAPRPIEECGPFWLSVYSKTLGTYHSVGKAYAKLSDAQKAAARRDRNRPGEFTFLDNVPPKRGRATIAKAEGRS